MTVGEKIRKYRQERELTQKALGKLCGMQEANVRKYELGKANPKQETLLKIARALGVHLRDLVDSSIWEEYDREHPAQVESVVRFEAVLLYLRKMGFEGKVEQSGETEFEVTLSKDGHTATFTDKEFDDLLLGAKESIEGRFYRKVLEQQRNTKP